YERAANRSGQKILQPARAAYFPHLRQLVGRTSRIRGRSSFLEENQWADVRRSGRNMVVNDMTTHETRNIGAASTVPSGAAQPDYTRPLAIFTTLFFMW